MAWATIATAGAITLGSIWGTLARLGLVALNTYDGQSIAPLVWAQAVGCLVFGYASHKRSKAAIEGWYAPAFPMITVGFAGSCTSFSTWALDVFQAFSNGEHHDRIGLYSVMDALAQTATTVGMGLAGVWAGRALADAYPCFVRQVLSLDGNYRFLTRHEALTTAFMCASGQGGR